MVSPTRATVYESHPGKEVFNVLDASYIDELDLYSSRKIIKFKRVRRTVKNWSMILIFSRQTDYLHEISCDLFCYSFTRSASKNITKQIWRNHGEPGTWLNKSEAHSFFLDVGHLKRRIGRSGIPYRKHTSFRFDYFIYFISSKNRNIFARNFMGRSVHFLNCRVLG